MKRMWWIFTALFGGVLVGHFAPQIAIQFSILGDLFMAALWMIVVPLILAAVMSGMARMARVRHFRSTGLRTIGYYFATTTTAVLVGLILVNLIRPGEGIDLGSPLEVPDVIGAQGGSLGSFFSQLVVGLFQNPFHALASGKSGILAIIVFALFFGGALASLGKKGESLAQVLEVFNDTMMKLTSWIMRFAPFGVFGLIAKTVSIHGLGVLGGLGKYMLCVVLGLLIHAGILLFFYLKAVGRMDVSTFLAGVREPLAIAFSTASSAVALPVTMESCHKNLKVPKSVTGFVLPLGATINMDGTALYEAAGAMFIAQAYGISLGPEQQFIIFLTAILASVGAAAIPHAGLITMAIVLASVGLPLAGIGLILAIDKPLDMCRTMVNVMGDSIGTVVVGRGVPQDG